MNVEELLLVLKVAFLVLLYLFIGRIVRTASRDLRLPQESFILRPDEAEGLRREIAAATSGRLVVMASPALEEGEEFQLDSMPVTVGRSDDCVVALDADESIESVVPVSSAGLATTTRRPSSRATGCARSAEACCGERIIDSWGRRRSRDAERTIRQMKR